MNEYCVCWDVETTGLNPKEDFIIQLSLVKFRKDNFEYICEKNWYIKPSHKYEISEGAQKVHNLSKEFIEEHGIYFKEIYNEFCEIIKDSDLLTYNGNTFDIRFLNEECKRGNLQLPIEGKMFYDSYAMECRFSPRDLSSVFNKYTGEIFEGAHDALNDVKATVKVFECQMKSRGLGYEDINEFKENNLLTPDGSIRNAAAPEEPLKIVFNVGKYKDSEFLAVLKNDPSYVRWYLENIASNYTKKILADYKKRTTNNF